MNLNGDRVLSCRAEQGMSQRQVMAKLADVLCGTGYKPPQGAHWLSAIETGKPQAVSEHEATVLAAVLGVGLSWLLDLEDVPADDPAVGIVAQRLSEELQEIGWRLDAIRGIWGDYLAAARPQMFHLPVTCKGGQQITEVHEHPPGSGLHQPYHQDGTPCGHGIMTATVRR